MKISIRGMLNNLRRAIASGDHPGGELYTLEQMVRHLRMLRDEPKRVGEFFALYVDVEPLDCDFPMRALHTMVEEDSALDMVRRMDMETRTELLDALRTIGDDVSDVPS